MKAIFRVLSYLLLLLLIGYVIFVVRSLFGIYYHPNSSNEDARFYAIRLTLPWNVILWGFPTFDPNGGPYWLLLAFPALLNAGLLFRTFRYYRKISN